jgi:peptidoglycan/LPS O-acetylase OafA/YrhL
MLGFHDIDASIFWLAIVLIVFMSLLFGYLRRSAKYRMIERLAEKGQTISPELLAGVSNGNGHDHRYRSPVQSGIFLMCIGIAIALFFWAMSGGGNPFVGEHVSWLPVIGIFPFMVGLARLLGGLTDRRPAK